MGGTRLAGNIRKMFFTQLADATQAAPVPSDPYTRQNVMWFCSNICGGKDLRIKCSQSLLVRFITSPFLVLFFCTLHLSTSCRLSEESARLKLPTPHCSRILLIAISRTISTVWHVVQ